MKFSTLFTTLYEEPNPRPFWKGVLEAMILLICFVLILKVFGLKGPPSETGVWPYMIVGVIIASWPPKWRFI